MFGRSAAAICLAFANAACAAGSGDASAGPSQSQASDALPPELAALVAQPQTGSFNPEAAKDAEFFKDTPERFRPFIAVCNPWDEWNKPAPPFKIYGDSYYVGTCGIAAILITSDTGHTLIDTGTREGAEVIAKNVRTLGFEPEDIELILYSHEHHDHMGGHAFMQRLTGASVGVTTPAISQISRGKTNPEDPQFGLHPDTEPVPDTMILPLGHIDGDNRPFSVTVGTNELSMHKTPGHTPGALTWQWRSCEGDDCKMIVYADSLSPISADDYAFGERPEYVASYRGGLEGLARLECDILLTPHPSHSRMLRRMRRNTLVEPSACIYYAIDKSNDLEQRLQREAEGNP